MAEIRTVVVGGVDCHSEFHHAVALDDRGRKLDELRFAATGQGCRQAVGWLLGLGEVDAVGVESSGSYGAELSRVLTRAGIAVVEVNRPHAHVRHRRGKSDAVDAEAAARKVLAGETNAIPKNTSGVVEAIRQLKVAKEGALKARAAALVQLRDLIVTAPADLREPLSKRKTLRGRSALCRCFRPDPNKLAEPIEAAKFSLRSLSRRIAALDEEVTEIDRRLEPLVRQVAPRTAGLFGLGVAHTSQMLVTAGQNIDRIRSEGAFAHLCGADPIPASSGKTVRHRLNPGGDRDANSALHMIAVVRPLLRTHPSVCHSPARGRTQQERGHPLPQALHREGDLQEPPGGSHRSRADLTSIGTNRMASRRQARRSPKSLAGCGNRATGVGNGRQRREGSMDDPLVIGLVILAVIVIAGVIYWMTQGKTKKLEQQRERAAEHRQEAQGAAQRAGEAEVAARGHAEEAERERERAMELQRKAEEVDPDHRS